MIYFFNPTLQEYFMPYLQGGLQWCCRDVTRVEISPAALFPAAICSTLGGHFTLTDAVFPLSQLPALQHSDDDLWFLSWSDRPCFVFVSSENSHPFLPWLTHSHCLYERQTHSCHTVSPISQPRPDFHTWQSGSGSVELAGVHIRPPFLTHVTNEKRDKRDRHIKGWRARLGFLKLRTDAERPNLAQTRKTPLNDSICCVSTALATPILCHIASFPSTATAYSTQTVCA